MNSVSPSNNAVIYLNFDKRQNQNINYNRKTKALK